MLDNGMPEVAIIDYGLGNLFSVKHACNKVGLNAIITNLQTDILRADAVILPGVGAFGGAMETLKRLDLIGVLRDVASSGKPFLGICLGMQLLMSESFEFGRHYGLGIIQGTVVHFNTPLDASGKRFKVPHVGWNKIYKAKKMSQGCDSWENTLLEGLGNGEFMYFVHSFYIKPEDVGITLSVARYGNIEFCASIKYKNIYACQFHPERSGPKGLQVYKNFLKIVTSQLN